MTTGRKLAHHYADEIRPMRQAVPYRESQRRVAGEVIRDFVSGLAILAAVGVSILAAGRFLILLVELLPWSAIYVVIVALGLFALCLTAARADGRER